MLTALLPAAMRLNEVKLLIPQPGRAARCWWHERSHSRRRCAPAGRRESGARALQHGIIVITKSTHRARILENAQIFDFALSAGEMAELDALDQTGGTDSALESGWW
jgi:hypothetical protein